MSSEEEYLHLKLQNFEKEEQPKNSYNCKNFNFNNIRYTIQIIYHLCAILFIMVLLYMMYFIRIRTDDLVYVLINFFEKFSNLIEDLDKILKKYDY